MANPMGEDEYATRSRGDLHARQLGASALAVSVEIETRSRLPAAPGLAASARSSLPDDVDRQQVGMFQSELSRHAYSQASDEHPHRRRILRRSASSAASSLALAMHARLRSWQSSRHSIFARVSVGVGSLDSGGGVSSATVIWTGGLRAGSTGGAVPQPTASMSTHDLPQ